MFRMQWSCQTLLEYPIKSKYFFKVVLKTSILEYKFSSAIWRPRSKVHTSKLMYVCIRSKYTDLWSVIIWADMVKAIRCRIRNALRAFIHPIKTREMDSRYDRFFLFCEHRKNACEVLHKSRKKKPHITLARKHLSADNISGILFRRSKRRFLSIRVYVRRKVPTPIFLKCVGEEKIWAEISRKGGNNKGVLKGQGTQASHRPTQNILTDSSPDFLKTQIPLRSARWDVSTATIVPIWSILWLD